MFPEGSDINVYHVVVAISTERAPVSSQQKDRRGFLSESHIM